MNIQTKQRIVGLVIVIAVIALLIPFLFVGKKNVKTAEVVVLDVPREQQEPTIAMAKIESPTSSVPQAPVIAASNNVAPQTAATSASLAKPAVNVVAPNVISPTINNLAPAKTAPITNPVSSTKDNLVKTDGPLGANDTAVAPASANNILTEINTDELTTDSLKFGKAVSAAPAATPAKVMPAASPPPPQLPVTQVTSASSPSEAAPLAKQEQKVMNLLPPKHVSKPSTVTTKATVKKNAVKESTKLKKNLEMNGAWSVYLGDFPEEQQNGVVKKLRDRGYRAYTKVIKTPDGAFVGIYVGHLKTPQQASQLVHEIQQTVGLNGEVAKNK